MGWLVKGFAAAKPCLQERIKNSLETEEPIANQNRVSNIPLAFLKTSYKIVKIGINMQAENRENNVIDAISRLFVVAKKGIKNPKIAKEKRDTNSVLYVPIFLQITAAGTRNRS